MMVEKSLDLTSRGVLEVLNGIGKRLNALQDLDDVYALILIEGAALLGAEHADLALVQRQSGNLLFQKSTRFDDGVPENRRTMPRNEGVCGWVARTGETAIIGNVEFDERYRGSFPETRSELAFPLKIDGEVVGVLNFESTVLNAFSHIHDEALEGLAGHATNAIKRAQELERILGLQRIERAILNSGLDRQATLNKLLGVAVELLQPTNCQIALYDREARELEIVASNPREAVGQRVALEDCVSGEAVLLRKLIHYDDVPDRDNYKSVAEQEGIQSEIAAPLIANGDDGPVLGVFNVENAFRFSASDVEFMKTLATQAAISIKTAGLVDQQARQHAQLKVLHAVDEAIIDPTRDLEQTLHTILSQGLGLLDCPHGGLWLAAGSQRLVVKAQMGDEIAQRRTLRIGQGIVGEAAELRRAQIVENVKKHPGYVCSIDATRSELAIPLVDGQRLVGVFDAQSPQEGFFGEHHLEILEALANPIVVAIRNAEQQDVILDLGSIISEINSAGNVQEVLRKVLDCALRLLKVSRGLILTLDRGQRELTPKIAHGVKDLAQAQAAVAQSRVIEEIRNTGRAAVVSDAVKGQTITKGARSILGAPLLADGVIIGVIYLESQLPDYFSSSHRKLLALFADGAALALENSKRRSQELREETWRRIKTYNRDLLHWTVNKAGPIFGTAERVRAALGEGQDAAGLAGELDLVIDNASALLEAQNKFKDVTRDLDLEAVDVEKVLRKSVAGQFADSSQCEIEVSSSTPLIYVDELQIEKVFENMNKNAREAMAEQADSLLRITARPIGDGGRVLVSFSDNGSGIAPEVMERIFDPFYTTKKDGSGFGLAVSKDLVHQMGGRIEVHSELGVGTTFDIELPAVSG